MGPRPYAREHLDHALRYPWAGEPASFVLDAGAVTAPGAVPEEFTGPDRHPLLAYGSNADPLRLALKLEGLPLKQRRLAGVAGDLHGFDVGPSVLPTFYGALPAVLFESPGSVVRASILWVTAAQLEAITWTEVSYRLGRLDGIRFDAGHPGAPPVTSVLAFAGRLGAHHVDGGPVALAAVPARRRPWPALTQEELLDGLAAEHLGGRAEDLVRALHDDFGATIAALAPVQLARAVPFAAAGWTPYPA